MKWVQNIEYLQIISSLLQNITLMKDAGNVLLWNSAIFPFLCSFTNVILHQYLYILLFDSLLARYFLNSVFLVYIKYAPCLFIKENLASLALSYVPF